MCCRRSPRVNEFFLVGLVFLICFFHSAGKKLIVTTKVDKSILGGLIIDFDGEHYVDMSIRKKFNQFSNLLRQPV